MLVGQVVFKLWIKTVKLLFLIDNSRTTKPTKNFDTIFEFLGYFTISYIHHF